MKIEAKERLMAKQPTTQLPTEFPPNFRAILMQNLRKDVKATPDLLKKLRDV